MPPLWSPHHNHIDQARVRCNSQAQYPIRLGERGGWGTSSPPLATSSRGLSFIPEVLTGEAKGHTSALLQICTNSRSWMILQVTIQFSLSPFKFRTTMHMAIRCNRNAYHLAMGGYSGQVPANQDNVRIRRDTHGGSGSFAHTHINGLTCSHSCDFWKGPGRMSFWAVEC